MENENKVETNENVENQVKEEVKVEPKVEESEDVIQKAEEKDKRRAKKVARVIWNIVMWAIIIVIAFETVMGFLNMQRLNEDKEPIWYISTRVEKAEGKKETIYNMGLYEINKIEENGGKRVILKPFFIKD